MLCTSVFRASALRYASSPQLPQPHIPLPPPLSLTPSSLLLRRHPLRDVAPRQRKQSPPEPEPELDPEGRPLRHEECPGTEAKEHHRERNALLPAHAHATILLGMSEAEAVAVLPWCPGLFCRIFVASSDSHWSCISRSFGGTDIIRPADWVCETGCLVRS